MEIFSRLLAICARNSQVTGEFPAQTPVTRSFDVFFDLHLNKRLSKQLWGWWFETQSCPLWCHCNGFTHAMLFHAAWRFALMLVAQEYFIMSHLLLDNIWARSQSCTSLITWCCYQMIAKPGNKTGTLSWPDPYATNTNCENKGYFQFSVKFIITCIDFKIRHYV